MDIDAIDEISTEDPFLHRLAPPSDGPQLPRPSRRLRQPEAWRTAARCAGENDGRPRRDGLLFLADTVLF
jgi:hypothetical protein